MHSFAAREKKRSIELATSATSSVNYRYLTSHEKKARLRSTKNETRAVRIRLKRLEVKLSEIVEKNGIVPDEELSTDMCDPVDQSDSHIRDQYKDDTFQYLFWEQQKEAMGREGVKKNGIRWHPLVFKWCLYLRHQSSKAYETLRDSVCIALPSQRTLRDYSNAVKASAGFSSEVDHQLLKAAKLESSQKHHTPIALLIDEMTIKEDLVYDKHSGKVVGFINLDDDDMGEIILGKSMIAFMVKGALHKS